MATFTKGKKAYGFCDRGGHRVPLKDLVPQFENLRPSGLLVDKAWLDIDHEQLQLGRVRSDDNQTLENPRPDRDLVESQALSAWDPVGGGVTAFGSRTVGLDLYIKTGRVTVSIG